jgi:V8-like Glu-specific endopeptidase
MTELKDEAVDELVSLLSRQASSPAFANPQEFFRFLTSSAHLPDEWQQSLRGTWSGNARVAARNLMEFAKIQSGFEGQYTYTTLGVLLKALLDQKLPPDDTRMVVSIMIGYKQVLDKKKLNELRMKYAVPIKASIGAGEEDNSPDFDWHGPDSELELQGFFTPDLPWQDVGFLRRAMKCASSVCLIKMDKESGTGKEVTGSGFLISDELVLTNYHVLKPTAASDIQANARNAVVKFAVFTSAEGEPEKGIEYKLTEEEPIVAQSAVADLDFVLLRVEPKVRAEKSIVKVELDTTLPAGKSSLNLLHHPGGDTMKLSTSGNGVTGIYADKGLVQYVTSAAEGSSGSPCFTDDWKVVALHHAQRSRAWGSIREGILMKDILARIHQHLDD